MLGFDKPSSKAQIVESLADLKPFRSLSKWIAIVLKVRHQGENGIKLMRIHDKSSDSIDTKYHEVIKAPFTRDRIKFEVGFGAWI